jgi:hypothetical protein
VKTDQENTPTEINRSKFENFVLQGWRDETESNKSKKSSWKIFHFRKENWKSRAHARRYLK